MLMFKLMFNETAKVQQSYHLSVHTKLVEHLKPIATIYNYKTASFDVNQE